MSEANPFIICEASESVPQHHEQAQQATSARVSSELANSSEERRSLEEFTKTVPPNKRLQATRWFLTFPQTNVTKEEALRRLKEHAQLNQLGIKGLMIAQEKHKDNHLHLHIALWLNKKLNTTNRKYFDFVCE